MHPNCKDDGQYYDGLDIVQHYHTVWRLQSKMITGDQDDDRQSFALDLNQVWVSEWIANGRLRLGG
jgi:hypothetical protein